MSEFNGRLVITGEITVESGLHIGSGETEGIGLVDNCTIRDPLTQRPIIPGSSLKGKLRYALDQLLQNDQAQINRLFGATAERQEEGGHTRLFVRDCHLAEDQKMIEELESLPTPYVEVKNENRIHRATGVAEHPRQTERLPARSKLTFEIVYNLYSETEASEDLQNLKAALDFIEDEYIGSSGSRGYGRVRFEPKLLEWKSKDSYLGRTKSYKKEIEKSMWLKEAANLIGLK